jgi:hypothetical protein
MADWQDEIRAEASRLLSHLETADFDACCPLSRRFDGLPPRPGIYALKHRSQGILYIGKSGNVKNRLRGGHKALGWAFIDRLDPDDVRVAFVVLAFRWTRLSLQLDGYILRQAQPPYNERIGPED